jgi:general secretion pathway protein G
MKKSACQGFTLVELMIVVAIIGLLVGVLLVNIGSQREKANRTRALMDIKEMDTALGLYQADNGFYPTAQQGIQALLTAPTTPPIPRNWNGPYLRNRSQVPIDPWGNEYVYTCPGEHNPTAFDLFSYGKDGRAGGSDNDADVVPWDN